MQANGVDVEKARMSRSYLFVPADSERKLKKAGSAGADSLILDLEDAVLPDRRPEARLRAAEFLHGSNDAWVRINPMDTDDSLADLEAVMPAGPAGIVLPKPRSGAELVALSDRLDALEHQHGIEHGTTRIIALCTERAEALFTLYSYKGATPRLHALSWGAEDLGAEIGAIENRDRHGAWTATFEMARAFCLLAAAAAEVAALDTVFTDFRDREGLLRYAGNARRDGFTGMLAIHPSQVEVINSAFLPSEEEIERARRVVALFDEHPTAGALALDGKMIDRPHLVQAQRLLRLAACEPN